MSYWKDLSFLERGMAAGAIDGATAIETLMALNSQRQETRQARRSAEAAAQQDALTSLVSAAQTGASAAQTMDELRPLLDSISTQAGLPSMNYGQIPAIAPLFEGGVSAVDPGLDAEDEAVIMKQVHDALASNPSATELEIRKSVHEIQRPLLGGLYQRLAPSIDDVVNRIYGRST